MKRRTPLAGLDRHRRQPRALAAIVGLAAGVVFSAASALLAQEGPIVVGKREKPPIFSLHDWRGELEFLWRYRQESRQPTGAEKVDVTENHFEETLTLESHGHIYHPNLVQLDLAGTAGLTQTMVEDSQNDSQNFNGTIYEYDLNALFLRKEVAPVTVYARRTQETIDREFGPTLDSILNTYGAIWDIQSKTLPTRFELYHLDQSQTGIANNDSDFGDLSLSQNVFTWHTEYRPYEGHVVTWDYSLSQVTEQTSGLSDNDYWLNDANLSYSIDFGPGDRSNLTSSLSYYDQTGDYPFGRFRWLENLLLHHNDSFETKYLFLYDWQEFTYNDGETNNQDRIRGAVGFTHWLYDSLVTTGNAGCEFITASDDSNSNEYFGDLRFDYTKSVPFGTLSLFNSLAYDWRENSSQVTPTPVIDAARVFQDPRPIVLVGNAVDPNNIRITDPSGLILYRPGIDYTVTPYSDRVEIDRVIGGLIPNGQVVLVDYFLVPQSEATVTTTYFAFGGRYDIQSGFLNGLSLYARYGKQDQTFDSGDDAFIPNTFTDITYGVEYRIYDFTFSAERETRDANISPFDATRYEIQYGRRLTRDFLLNLFTTYTQIDYTDVDNHVDLLTASGSFQWRITRELYLAASVAWRDEEDDLRGTTRGLEEQIEFNWRRRQTTVYGLLRNSNLESDFQDNSFLLAEIGIRREF